jgi:microsomal dipeptidase-like Zn-dependent dipeptidase
MAGLAAISAASVVGMIAAAEGGGAGPDALAPRVLGADSKGQPAYGLANRCFAIRSLANAKFVAAAGPDAYRANRSSERQAIGFFMKPSGLGRYLPYDEDGNLLELQGKAEVGRATAPGRLTEWAPARVSTRAFLITSTANRRRLAVARGSGRLVLAGVEAGDRRRFAFVPKRGCRRFPEAGVGATGRPFRGTNRDGTVLGFADIHLHITADMRAGGRVLYGESFDPFGITRALGLDAREHGPDGSADVTGNLLRTGLPFGTHDTHGWPTFAGWPVHDTNTHQQIYYRWLERVWRDGERLVVAQTVEDAPLCRVEPVHSHSCDETKAIKLQIRRLRALQGYVDAQSGGPGRGWFRLVYSPRQARRVIERGRLAAVIGIESSNPFGCSELEGKAQCDRRDIVRGLAAYRRLGVRSLFIAHWVDNALAGAALEGGLKGAFINVLNKFQTGSYFETGPCPDPSQGEEPESISPFELQVLAQYFPAAAALANEPVPDYPPGKQCNVRGLTKLGAYLIRRLIANHMLIEVDHLSEKARERALAIAKAHHYPLVSSHTDTGGHWTPSELRRLYALGGIATARPEQAPELAATITGLRPYRSPRRYFGVPLGTDTGGFSSLPGPRADAAQNPLRYPFRSFRGGVKLTRQRTGRRTFDLNTDGEAHYGLLADLLADVQHTNHGRDAIRLLFRSAEAYLQMWRRATAR